MWWGRPVEFPAIPKKIGEIRKKTGENEGITTGVGEIGGEKSRALRHGQRFYDGEHGSRRGREVYPCCGESHRGEASRHRFYRIRRRTDAGGACFPDADGENVCGAGAAFRRGTAVCGCYHGPDDRRCDGKLLPCWAT